MPSPTTTHRKILIVEDEKDILQLVKLYLEKDGFRTVSAMTGTEGLRQVKADKSRGAGDEELGAWSLEHGAGSLELGAWSGGHGAGGRERGD